MQQPEFTFAFLAIYALDFITPSHLSNCSYLLPYVSQLSTTQANPNSSSKTSATKMSKRQQTFDSSNAFPRYHEKLRRSSISDNDNPFASFPLPTSLQDPDRNENNKITHQEPVVFVPPPRPSDPQSQAQASTVPNQDTTNNSIPTQSPNFSSGTANEIPPVSVSLDEIFQDIFERTRCSAIPLIVLKGPSGEMPLQDVLVKFVLCCSAVMFILPC